MTRILIADDHPLFRAALRQAVMQSVDGAEVAEVDRLEAVHADLEAHPETDLVLLDLFMPGSEGLTGLVSVRCQHPSIAVVVVSALEDPAIVRRALDHGAQGFIPKSASLEELAVALQTVLRCEDYLPPALRPAVGRQPGHDEDRELAARFASLTPQQYRVLERVARGQLNKQIADALGIQERTVKAHLSDIFLRLGVRNRTQAGVLFQKLDLGRH